MTNNFKVGIVDYSVYLPEQTISAEELSPLVNIPADVLREKLGISQKYVGGPEDHPGMMATKAAKDLIAKTGLDPLDIDMILYAGETYAEYICWTVGIHVQHEIKADNAYAWDLSFRCAATPLALKTAKDMMNADRSLKTVLIVGGNANSNLVDYSDPNQSSMFNMCPAGLAILLKADHDENLVLESAIITDSSFSVDVIGEYGGTLKPLTKEMVLEMVEDEDKIRQFNYLQVPDGIGLKKRLGERSFPNFKNVIEKASSASGYETNEIDYLALVHLTPKFHYYIMDELGIEREKTHFLAEYGHCGHADQLIAITEGLNRGLIHDGDIVAMVGAGTGYAFTATLVQWGKA